MFGSVLDFLCSACSETCHQGQKEGQKRELGAHMRDRKEMKTRETRGCFRV